MIRQITSLKTTFMKQAQKLLSYNRHQSVIPNSGPWTKARQAWSLLITAAPELCTANHPVFLEVWRFFGLNAAGSLNCSSKDVFLGTMSRLKACHFSLGVIQLSTSLFKSDCFNLTAGSTAGEVAWPVHSRRGHSYVPWSGDSFWRTTVGFFRNLSQIGLFWRFLVYPNTFFFSCPLISVAKKGLLILDLYNLFF